MSNFTFTDRASYKAYVANWKTTYKQLSADIRHTKAEMKLGGPEEQSPHQYRREMLRREARWMLQERADAKVVAQEQYQAEKLTKALV